MKKWILIAFLAICFWVLFFFIADPIADLPLGQKIGLIFLLGLLICCFPLASVLVNILEKKWPEIE